MPSQDATLRELVASGLDPEQIAAELTKRGPVPRSKFAVRKRLNALGLSTRDGWMSGEDLIRSLGIYRARVTWFEQQGLLTPSTWGRWRRYRIAEVEALIESQAGLTIDPRRVRDPRFKALAETAAAVNRRRQAS
jgi:hypothetical protein